MLYDKKTCRICNNLTNTLLNVTNVPPLQNRYYKSYNEAIQAELMDVSFHLCPECKHISVHKTKQKEFDAHYNNRQVKSEIVAKLYNDIANDIASHMISTEARILEIGCGRGELLEILLKYGFRNIVGYDPAAPTSTPYLHNTKWDHQCQESSFDLVILRHTLEEIENPMTLIKALQKCMRSNGRLYCEITNAAYLVEHELFFSLFPEYVNLFSPLSLSKLYTSAGFTVTDITSIKGGEWLGVWGKLVDSTQKGATDTIRMVKEAISKLPKPVFLWGAGGRAGNMLSFMKIGLAEIEYVVDIDEDKQGLFIPPNGQKIISPEECRRLSPKSIVVVNALYRDEIARKVPTGTYVITLDEILKQDKEGLQNG